MAAYDTRLSLNGAYSLDATLLQDVVERANAFPETETHIKFNFSDVHELASKKLSDLLQDSLMRTDPITQISIDGRNFGVDPWRSFTVQSCP
jgi:hypothetical protein